MQSRSFCRKLRGVWWMSILIALVVFVVVVLANGTALRVLFALVAIIIRITCCSLFRVAFIGFVLRLCQCRRRRCYSTCSHISENVCRGAPVFSNCSRRRCPCLALLALYVMIVVSCCCCCYRHCGCCCVARWPNDRLLKCSHL